MNISGLTTVDIYVSRLNTECSIVSEFRLPWSRDNITSRKSCCSVRDKLCYSCSELQKEYMKWLHTPGNQDLETLNAKLDLVIQQQQKILDLLSLSK